MIVYMTQGQKTVLSRITVEGLPLHYLSVGRGYFARRRALRCLRQMYDSGVRRCICADVYLLSLAKQVDITSYPVLPLRLALLGSLLDILCPGGLQNAAAALTAAGKWQISDIHITDLLDIRTESHYNAT